LNGYSETVTVGLEADSTILTIPNPALNNSRPSVFINETGFPVSTRPLPRTCFRIYQSTINTSLAGWNLLSVGVRPPQDNYSKSSLYPAATTAPFAFDGRYSAYTVLRNGLGYWMKFAAGQNAGARGGLIHHVVDSLRAGWNLIGAIGFPVATGNVVVNGTSLTSPFIGYYSGYSMITTLRPGQGYWVRASNLGTLTIDGTAPAASPKGVAMPNIASMNSITITDLFGRHQTLYLAEQGSLKEGLDFYELPPAAPDFDVRFASQRMIETYPSHLEEKGVYIYPIDIETDAYPLTITWNTVRPAERKIVLKSADGKLGNTIILEGSGNVKIPDADVKDIRITLENIVTPREYSLHQNFPNPFNPATRIRFELRDAGYVSLKVFDLLGKEVANLVSENRPAGAYDATWGAERFASGMYFYELRAGSFVDIKKMVLIR
jgi:hypothetical protein